MIKMTCQWDTFPQELFGIALFLGDAEDIQFCIISYSLHNGILKVTVKPLRASMNKKLS